MRPRLPLNVRTVLFAFFLISAEPSTVLGADTCGFDTLYRNVEFQKIKGVGFVPSFSGEPVIVRRTFLEPKKIQQAQANLRKLPVLEQPKAAFDVYLESRLINYPPWVKRKIHDEARASKPLTTDIQDLRSHYENLASNLEYSIQKAESGMGLTKKLESRLADFGALRAQWEFNNLLPSSDFKPPGGFDQFRAGRTRSQETTTAANLTSAPLETKIQLADGYTARHEAALGDLVTLRVISKAEADQMLRSGDSEKLEAVLDSPKIPSAQKDKLRALFSISDSTTPASRPTSSAADSVAKAVAKADPSPGFGIEDLLNNPESLRNGRMIEFPSEMAAPVRMNFTDRALDEISKIERPIVQKFVNSIRTGMSSTTIDPTKVRVLSYEATGRKGRPFEVVIVQRGHARLFGCVKDGTYTVMTYDAHAPDTLAAHKVKYARLCD